MIADIHLLLNLSIELTAIHHYDILLLKILQYDKMAIAVPSRYVVVMYFHFSHTFVSIMHQQIQRIG